MRQPQHRQRALVTAVVLLALARRQHCLAQTRRALLPHPEGRRPRRRGGPVRRLEQRHRLGVACAPPQQQGVQLIELAGGHLR